MVKPPRTVFGIDVARIEQAIQIAERPTSGELRVAVSRFYFWGDVRRAAEIAFSRLGMHRTRHRNAVLLFVAPRLRRFAIVADTGIGQRVVTSFWADLAQTLRTDFAAGDRTAGLEHAIDTIGEVLALHFPAEQDDMNELSNQVVT